MTSTLQFLTSSDNSVGSQMAGVYFCRFCKCCFSAPGGLTTAVGSRCLSSSSRPGFLSPRQFLFAAELLLAFGGPNKARFPPFKAAIPHQLGVDVFGKSR